MEKKTRKPAASKAKAETKKVTATKATKSAAEPKSDAYAIFETGGKQYQAILGGTVAIEKLNGEVGDKVAFENVLLRRKADGSIEVGKPFLKEGIKASIVRQFKEPKIVVFRFKRRKKVRVKNGHRQPKTVVRIETV